MTPIQEEWFNTRAYRTLRNEGIETLEEMAAYGIRPMLRIFNVGEHTIANMREVLTQHGLQFIDENSRSVVLHRERNDRRNRRYLEHKRALKAQAKDLKETPCPTT